jgi:hypothetical protein
VQKDPHFLFLLSTTASPTICQAACTIEEGFISDYNRGFILAHESGWQFKMDPPPVTPPKTRASASVTQRQEQRLWIKFGSKRGIGAVHGQVDWLPSGTTPTSFCATLFFSVVFCVGVPLPLGWRFVTKRMLADLDSSVFGKTRTIRKISKSRTHCFKPDCLKRSKSSCILPGSSLL